MSIFEKASRQKLRFDYRGPCSVEDLWDIPLSALNNMFQSLNLLARTESESLLIPEKNSEGEDLTLQIEIIRHVVATRLQERDEAESEKTRADRKQQLLGILAEKQDDSLREMPVEDLKKLIGEL